MEYNENLLEKCWICRRTYEKSSSDYKKIILSDKYTKLPERVSEQLKSNEGVFPHPECSAFNEYYLESKLMKVEDRKYKEIKGEEFEGRVCICSVCAGILYTIIQCQDDKVSHEELQKMVWVVKKDDNNKGSEN